MKTAAKYPYQSQYPDRFANHHRLHVHSHLSRGRIRYDPILSLHEWIRHLRCFPWGTRNLNRQLTLAIAGLDADTHSTKSSSSLHEIDWPVANWRRTDSGCLDIQLDSSIKRVSHGKSLRPSQYGPCDRVGHGGSHGPIKKGGLGNVTEFFLKINNFLIFFFTPKFRIIPEFRRDSLEFRRKLPEFRRKLPEFRRKCPEIRQLSPEFRIKTFLLKYPQLFLFSPYIAWKKRSFSKCFSWIQAKTPEFRTFRLKSPEFRKLSPEIAWIQEISGEKVVRAR